MVAKGEVRGGMDLEFGINRTIVYRMDKQRPIVQYRELYSISCDKP